MKRRYQAVHDFFVHLDITTQPNVEEELCTNSILLLNKARQAVNPVEQSYIEQVITTLKEIANVECLDFNKPQFERYLTQYFMHVDFARLVSTSDYPKTGICLRCKKFYGLLNTHVHHLKRVVSCIYEELFDIHNMKEVCHQCHYIEEQESRKKYPITLQQIVIPIELMQKIGETYRANNTNKVV
jgi:hypothetical protein|tara:strand:+ start:732 stop:1286 length:555 start_codon:yes stop_codon:yes gene_type:complete